LHKREGRFTAEQNGFTAKILAGRENIAKPFVAIHQFRQLVIPETAAAKRQDYQSNQNVTDPLP
jgi:hypothetical protein